MNRIVEIDPQKLKVLQNPRNLKTDYPHIRKIATQPEPPILPKHNSGLSTLLRPLPVDCWDWTKAIALPRVPGPSECSRRGLLGVLGAMP